MKISTVDNYMHVLDPVNNIWTVLRNIANSNEQEDAFYVCNISDIVYKFKTWKDLLPRVEPFYDVKCNNTSSVLEILAALGTGFRCTSKSDIQQVLSVGVTPDQIILANPVKPASQIKHAANSEISLMTFDSASELHKIKRLYPEANLIIRIRPAVGNEHEISKIKFGCDPTLEAPGLLNLARSLDLNVVGVSLDLEADCTEPEIYGRAIEAARRLYDYASTLGYNFNLFDLGTVFSVDRHAASIEDFSEIINNALDLYFPDTSVRFIAEPSRFFVSSAYSLACNIHSIRSVDKEDSATGSCYTHRMYFINDGVYGSFNFVLYDDQYLQPIPLNEHSMSKMYSSSIWGPTCDGLDQVIEEVILPDMNVGDWIVFENMGAYTLPVPCPMSGFPNPKVHIMADESTWNLLKEILPLTDEKLMMWNSPAPIKTSTEKLSLKIPTRNPLIDTIPLGSDNMFHFERLEWSE